MPTAGPPPEVPAYFDHASASPLRPQVIEALAEVLKIPQADPGRSHDEAIIVRDLIEDSRRQVAHLVGATPRQLVFTSAITESVTSAVVALGAGRRILAAGTERASVLDAARRCGHLEFIEVDRHGHLDLDHLDRLLTGDPALVCCQVANHETGVLTDPGPVVALARSRGAAVHLDAATATGHVELSLGELDADAVTVTGEMIGGPMGCAGLVVRRGRPFPHLLEGGAQERGRRPGLENLLGIVGFGVAAEALTPHIADEAERARRQIAVLEAAAVAVEGVIAVGDSDPTRRAPHLRCLTVEGIEAEPILLGLNRVGVSIHSGSACSSETLEPSAVLAAMGLDADRSIRISVGWSTTDDDVARFAAVFGPVISDLRALRA